jgi:hypothetical protein
MAFFIICLKTGPERWRWYRLKKSFILLIYDVGITQKNRVA